MIRPYFLLIYLSLSLSTYSQEKNFIDLPYLETTARVDTLVVPDRIFISITLSEADNRNKKSTEELEELLMQKLKELNINSDRDLTLLDYSSNFRTYFLKGQNILKAKHYSLTVHDAMTAGRVLSELESVGISNVFIEKTEYSKAVELELELKSIAIQRAKDYATRLIEPLGQKIGKVIYISDNNNNAVSNTLNGAVAGIRIRGFASYHQSTSPELVIIDFQKIKFESQVVARFMIQ